jgi:hypothetical protein
LLVGKCSLKLSGANLKADDNIAERERMPMDNSIALALPKGNEVAMRDGKVTPIEREGATQRTSKSGQLGDNLPIAEPSHHHLSWRKEWKVAPQQPTNETHQSPQRPIPTAWGWFSECHH